MTFPNRKHEREIGESGEQVHDAQTGDGAANEVVHEDRAQFRPRRDEVVAIPEARPGEHEEQQPDWEERDGESRLIGTLPSRLDLGGAA